ncbi:hypothetical protein SGFS_086230 [Streptomyces graminofaciens]|uniref:Amine oxidase domain-containing protein n=1 Tax=Streptomyces graminofaciens TaxID=68212 RepID=A0ABM7FLV9_9ACTN|nr:hypothetical protein [Streptomyces graminofaciens]BBC37329.1 hypothetical protein SGFS_086230 [Streptomyces graminofaciens]
MERTTRGADRGAADGGFFGPWASRAVPTSAASRSTSPPAAYFAGDWLSHTIAAQHVAFESARKAVSALHARVPTA